MTAWRVECESTRSRDPKTGEPLRWHFAAATRAEAFEIAVKQRGPCPFGCCPRGAAKVRIVSREDGR